MTGRTGAVIAEAARAVSAADARGAGIGADLSAYAQRARARVAELCRAVATSFAWLAGAHGGRRLAETGRGAVRMYGADLVVRALAVACRRGRIAAGDSITRKRAAAGFLLEVVPQLRAGRTVVLVTVLCLTIGDAKPFRGTGEMSACVFLGWGLATGWFSGSGNRQADAEGDNESDETSRHGFSS
jgi:hypothetical protein